MTSNKETILDKEYVKVKKDTFDSMNKVIIESKKVMEMQPKIKKVYDEVDNYAQSYRSLEKENKNIQKEVSFLKYKNQKLEQENKQLTEYLKVIFKAIKEFFREILQIGNDRSKNRAVTEIKDFYDNDDFKKDDIYFMAKDTDKEDELFDYTGVSKYHKKDKSDDFEIMM